MGAEMDMLPPDGYRAAVVRRRRLVGLVAVPLIAGLAAVDHGGWLVDHRRPWFGSVAGAWSGVRHLDGATGEVASVVDGVTLRVVLDGAMGEPVVVRLRGLRLPPLAAGGEGAGAVGAGAVDGVWARRAAVRAGELALRRRVRLSVDPEMPCGVDGVPRVLVGLPDGTELGDRLIEEGLAGPPGPQMAAVGGQVAAVDRDGLIAEQARRTQVGWWAVVAGGGD